MIYPSVLNAVVSALAAEAIDNTSKQAWQKLYNSADEEEGGSRVENELTSGETPESLLASRQIGEAVNEAIDALSEDLRQAITLREIEGLSYEEIAEMMNCPIGTVRSRIYRAREAIATRLRPMLDARQGERW